MRGLGGEPIREQRKGGPKGATDKKKEKGRLVLFIEYRNPTIPQKKEKRAPSSKKGINA